MKETRERMWMLLRDTDFLFYFFLIVSGLSRVWRRKVHILYIQKIQILISSKEEIEFNCFKN